VPNAMLEAMATGLPVITTPHGGIPEAIRNGENGLLVGENDHEGLAAAILKLLADQTLRQRLGEAGHRSVAEGFSQSLQSQRLSGLYQELIQRHRSES
jgi:colanic acid/amylovoran biosynthesis glycosyltransferase